MAEPTATPVTIPPEGVTVATPVLLLLHVPPVTPSLSVINEPRQTLLAPVMVPAVAPGLTVIVAVSTAVPQELV